MSNCHAAYEKSTAPQDLVDYYPKASTYTVGGKELYLFTETLEERTGTPAGDIVYVHGMELTDAELDVFINNLAASACTGKEIQLSKYQVEYLFNDRFYIEE